MIEMEEARLASPILTAGGLSPTKLSDSSRSSVVKQKGNFLLADFLNKRLGDIGDDDHDPEMMLKINQMLENDMLGDEDPDFQVDTPTDQNQRNTDENIEKEIARIRSLNKYVDLRNSENQGSYKILTSPLLDHDIQYEYNDKAVVNIANFRFEDEECKTHLGGQTFYDVASQIQDTELKTVTELPDKPIIEADDDDMNKQSSHISQTKHTDEIVNEVEDQYEFYSAAEFQSAYAFSKATDNQSEYP